MQLSVQIGEDMEGEVLNWFNFSEYLKKDWPRLWAKLKGETVEEAFEHLDLVCGFSGSKKLPTTKAIRKWALQLTAMHKMNGPIEF